MRDTRLYCATCGETIWKPRKNEAGVRSRGLAYLVGDEQVCLRCKDIAETGTSALHSIADVIASLPWRSDMMTAWIVAHPEDYEAAVRKRLQEVACVTSP